MAREILSKRNFFDFESPDSAISRFPMTLMKSMASLHQGPKLMHSSKNSNCFFIILPHSFFPNIGASNFYLDGSLKCNKNIYKIKDIWMRRVKVFTEVMNKMTHIRWKCEQHLNDANPLVAATW
jgi:hypothetical protein